MNESLHHRLGIAAGRMDKIARRIRIGKDDDRVYRRLCGYTARYLRRLSEDLFAISKPDPLIERAKASMADEIRKDGRLTMSPDTSAKVRDGKS